MTKTTKSKTALTGAVPEGVDYRDLKPNGQQLAYLILSPEERAKGFIRPYRTSYVHVGKRPVGKTREMTAAEDEIFHHVYALAEELPDGRLHYWTADDLKSGCGQSTKMAQAIAETYAADPYFYGGAFCANCGRHFNHDQFVWLDNPDQVLGT